MESVFYENLLFLVLFLCIIQIVGASGNSDEVSENISIGMNLRKIMGKVEFFLPNHITNSIFPIDQYAKTLPGVIDSHWNEKEHKLKITYRKEIISVPQLKEAIEQKGFTNIECAELVLADETPANVSM